MTTFEIVALLEAYAPETKYNVPYAEAHQTDKRKLELLLGHLSREFPGRVNVVGPGDDATILSEIHVSLGTQARKQYAAENPLGVIVIMVSIIGDFAVYSQDVSAPLKMKNVVRRFIEDAGLILLPPEVTTLESCYPGRSWEDLYFNYY